MYSYIQKITLGGLRDFFFFEFETQTIYLLGTAYTSPLKKKSWAIQMLMDCKDFPIWQVVGKLSFILALSVLIPCYFHLDLSPLIQ